MKRKNTLVGMALLIAVLMLGVGYALDTRTLSIDGTVDVTASSENFKVEFTAASAADTSNTASVDTTDKTKATLTVTTLKSVGDTATATFTVSNNSAAGISANIPVPEIVENENGDYFEVTTDWTATTLLPTDGSNSKVMTVTVKLIKAPVSDIEGKFTINLNATAETQQ